MSAGNFRPAYNLQRFGNPNVAYRPLGISMSGLSTVTTVNGTVATPQIFAGEPLMLTTSSVYAAVASNPVLRRFMADDIADFADSPAAGIFGFARHDAKTDSAGLANIQPVYSGKSASAEPTLQAPSYAATLPVDPTTGSSLMGVDLALPDMVWRGKLKTGTASNLSLGPAGLDLTSGVFTVDPSATTKIFNIVAWDPSDTTHVLFNINATYCAYLSGFIETE